MDRIDRQSYPLDRAESASPEAQDSDVRQQPRKLRLFAIRLKGERTAARTG